MNITCSVLEIQAFALKLLVKVLHQLAHRVFFPKLHLLLSSFLQLYVEMNYFFDQAFKTC